MKEVLLSADCATAAAETERCRNGVGERARACFDLAAQAAADQSHRASPLSDDAMQRKQNEQEGAMALFSGPRTRRAIEHMHIISSHNTPTPRKSRNVVECDASGGEWSRVESSRVERVFFFLGPRGGGQQSETPGAGSLCTTRPSARTRLAGPTVRSGGRVIHTAPVPHLLRFATETGKLNQQHCNQSSSSEPAVPVGCERTSLEPLSLLQPSERHQACMKRSAEMVANVLTNKGAEGADNAIASR